MGGDRWIEVSAGAEGIHELVRRDRGRIEEVALGQSGGEIKRIGEAWPAALFLRTRLDPFPSPNSYNLNIIISSEAAPSLIRAQQKLFPLVRRVLLLQVQDIIIEA